MAFEIPRVKYTGRIREVVVGTGPKAVTVGGADCYPFYRFEGEMPNPPRVAFEVWDSAPQEWQEWAIEPFRDVIGEPVLWAKKCIESYGAEMIVLQLKSADPNGEDKPVDEVVEVVKKVAGAIDVPLLVWGTANDDKDAELLRKVAEVSEGKNVAVGPVSDKNYKQIGAMAIGYGQVAMASSPIDVNLAKQLNILLTNLGVNEEKILIDPTTGGLGYGLEYTYSVMERDRMAALTQEDAKLQFPIICNLAPEVWKTRETRLTKDEDPRLGDEKKRSVLMEAVTAMTLLVAGADIVVMRHPDSVSLVKDMIGELCS